MNRTNLFYLDKLCPPTATFQIRRADAKDKVEELECWVNRYWEIFVCE
jgi:hypothetical protein